MDYFNEDDGIFDDDDIYHLAYYAEMLPTYTWQELEDMKINSLKNEIQATPDDWLDTMLWVKSLKETV